MLSSLKVLAVAVDGLSAKGLATLSETRSALTIAALRAVEATQLWVLATELGWPFEIVDVAGEHAVGNALTEDYAPFIITIQKPGQTARLQVITTMGFESFLLQECSDALWEIAILENPFATMSANFLPWNSTALFTPAPATKSPRELVRDQNIPPATPNDIRIWIPSTPVSEEIWGDAVFQVFADLSVQALMKALAGEIKSDGGLLFKGPPNTKLASPGRGAAKDFDLGGYNDLRNAATWVYQNEAEAEQRHGLFVAEFGRTHPPDAVAAKAFARITGNVLEGARLAYQLSLSDLTREAIKAQGDLRKAVADDTAKLADNTRQVVTSIAAALATCIGLVAAKAATTAPHWVLELVAAVAATYVIAVVVTGWIFMSVQREMRCKWRSRLYRFVPDADYKAMVIDPAKRAEAMFIVAAVGGGIVALAILIVLLAPWLSDIAKFLVDLWNKDPQQP